MFKVLCIDGSPGKGTSEKPNFKFGQICDATQCNWYADCYNISQHLYNKKSGLPQAWLKSRFIPLSDIDETELIKERNHETCKV